MKSFNISALISSAMLLFVSGCWFNPISDTKKSKKPKLTYAVSLTVGDMPQFENAMNFNFAVKPKQSQYEFIKLLNKAAKDPLVKEIVIHFQIPSFSFARAGEISDAIAQIASKGKPLSCHLDYANTLTYWMAARSCNFILMSPAANLELTGLGIETIYLLDFLNSIGVEADIMSIGKYKNAAEPLMENQMSDESKMVANERLDELTKIIESDISSKRKIKNKEIRLLLQNGPYDAKRALKSGLVDEIDTLSSLKWKTGKKYPGGITDNYGATPHEQISLTDIFKMITGNSKENDSSADPKIALIPASGPIYTGTSDGGMFSDSNVIWDKDLADTIYKALNDPSVKAVVLRIDSPGGDVLASDNIWHAVKKLAASKTVIASLGDVAASGGYYIASAATLIVSSPSTITGSIGVLGGKMVISRAAEKFGIHSHDIKKGPRSIMSSPFARFSDEERKLLIDQMRISYEMFIDRIVAGRNLERKKVKDAAQGRVWTGTKAHQIGLVDELGSLAYAIKLAKKQASLPDNIEVKIYPKPKTFMEMLGESLGGKSQGVWSLAKKYKAARTVKTMMTILDRTRIMAFAPFFFEIK